MTFLMLLSVVMLSMLIVLLSTLSVIKDLICKSDLRDIVHWGKKCLADFNAGATQLVPFDWANNAGAVDVKMDGSVLEEKSSFKMTCFSNFLFLTLS